LTALESSASLSHFVDAEWKRNLTFQKYKIQNQLFMVKGQQRFQEGLIFLLDHK
jgi:hypothetical protein